MALVYNEGVKQKKNHFMLWQHVIGICILAMTVLFSSLFLVEKTSDRLQDQMEKDRRTAFSHSSMVTVDTETVFHGQKAYASFIGKDQAGKKLAVLVDQADNTVYAYSLVKSNNLLKSKYLRQIERQAFLVKINSQLILSFFVLNNIIQDD